MTGYFWFWSDCCCLCVSLLTEADFVHIFVRDLLFWPLFITTFDFSLYEHARCFSSWWVFAEINFISISNDALVFWFVTNAVTAVSIKKRNIKSLLIWSLMDEEVNDVIPSPPSTAHFWNYWRRPKSVRVAIWVCVLKANCLYTPMVPAAHLEFSVEFVDWIYDHWYEEVPHSVLQLFDSRLCCGFAARDRSQCFCSVLSFASDIAMVFFVRFTYYFSSCLL